MGAWSEEAFGNDDAMDWLTEFESDPVEAITAAFRRVLEESDDYLEAVDAARSLAAAEVVAIAFGSPPEGMDDDIAVRITPHVPLVKEMDDILEDASYAALRILGDKSELAELWDEEDGGPWRASVADLIDRLK